MVTTRHKRSVPLKPKTKKRISGTRTLGLTARRHDQLVREVRSGFSYKNLTNLEKETGLSHESIAAFVAISPRTLARRRHTGKLRPDESDRVLRASRIFELALDLFEGDVDDVRAWLETGNPAMAGETPLAFASTDVGAREVERVIGRLQHGVFG